MLQRNKRLIIMIFLTFCLMLGGCGKRKEESSVELAETTSQSYTIHSQSLKISTQTEPISGTFQICWDTLYFQNKEETNSDIYRQTLGESVEPQKISLQMESSERLQAYTIDEEGNIYCFGDKNEVEYFFRSYKPEGTLIAEQDITSCVSETPDSYGVDKVVMDAKGILYAMTSGEILMFQKSGQYMGRVEAPTRNLLDLAISKEGMAFICFYKDGDMQQSLASIDAENGKMGEVIAIPGTGKLFTGTRKGLFTYDSRYLYEIDTTEGKYSAVLDLMRHYIKADSICAFGGKGTERFDFVVRSTGGGERYENSMELINLTYNPLAGNSATEEGKTIIHMVNLGTEGNDPMADIIMEFNKQSDQYFVTNELLGFFEDEELTTYVNTHMVSDECPDLMVINNVYYQTYAEAGILEDLSPYLAQSTLLSPDNYSDAAIAPFQVGDAIYGIPKGFSIMGLMGRKSQVKNLYNHMTIADFVSFLEKNPTAKFEYNGNPSGILEYCLKYGLEEFVDFEKGTCDFEGKEFRELLERINNMERTHYPQDESWEELIGGKEILLEEMMLNKIFGLEERSMEYGDELLFLGYPSAEGKMVCEIIPQDTMGIAKNSKQKEGAWEFLKYYLLNYELPTGIPAEKERFEAEWTVAKTPRYETDENGKQVEQPVKQIFVTINGEFNVVPAYALSEEKAEHIRKAVESAKPLKTDTHTILNIIWEEASGYFNGDKALDEVLHIIQSRCQLYLDENTN